MQIDWRERYAHLVGHMTSSAIRELLKVTEQPGFISFAGGLPAPEVFPVAEVAAVSARILREAGPQALQYGATEGYRPLRELIAANMRADGIPVTIDNVLITTGSQQAIDLVGKIFLDPGDPVVVESPTYLATLQAWRAYEARFLSVVADDCGMETDHLAALLVQQPKLAYVLPNFQNPSGVTLTTERREELVEISLRHGLPLLEDDPYREIRFEGEHLPRLIALESARRTDSHETYRGNVLSMSTFSKTLSPGLRVGWVIAAPQVIAQLVLAKQGTDLHTAMFNQMIAYEMIGSGFLEQHRPVIVDTYRERRDVMLASLAEHLPEGTRWTRPEGGLFLWVTLPEGISAEKLLQEAIKREVAFVPGRPFHVDGSGENTLRLNFSNSTPEQIREGIGRLGEALRALLGKETRAVSAGPHARG